VDLNHLRDAGRVVTMLEGHGIWVLRGGPAPSGDAVTDVFLHGLGGSSLPYRACAEAVETAGAPTLCIDLRGHGFSGKPDGDASIDDYTADVLRILEAEGVARANLIGHCLGGIVAMRIAEIAPEMVGALVLVGTSHRFGLGFRGMRRRYGARASDASVKIAAPHFRSARTPGQADVSHFPSHADLYLPRLRQDWAHTSLQVVLATVSAMCDADLTSALERTHARTCVIHARRDTFIDRSEAAEMARLSRAERFEMMPDDGHASLVLRADSPLPGLVCEFLHG